MRIFISILIVFLSSCSLKRDVSKSFNKTEQISKTDSSNIQKSDSDISILSHSKTLYNDSGRVVSKEETRSLKGSKKLLKQSDLSKGNEIKQDSTTSNKSTQNEVLYRVDKSIYISLIIIFFIVLVIVLRKPLGVIRFS